MRHRRLAVLAGAVALPFVAGAASAQEWSPPSRQMPSMEVGEGWQSSHAGWFLPGTALAGARAQANGGFVRFTSGPRPIAAWSDRNGDGRADMVQIYRGGTVVYQLLDGDYDGSADVLRINDANGSLQREERL